MIMHSGEYRLKDTVLSIDHGKIYEAKIMKVQRLDNDTKYFIHYYGWARKYDTWVDHLHLARKGDVADLERLNEVALDSLLPAAKRGKKAAQFTTLKIGKQMVEVDQSPIRRSKEEPTDTASISHHSTSDTTEQTKRSFKKGVEVTSFNTRTYLRDLLLQDLVDEVETDDLVDDRIKLTYEMKKHLLDEWNLVTKDYNSRWIRLPKRSDLTVKSIFDQFLEMKEAQLGTSSNKRKDATTGYEIDEYREFLHGLQVQFNKAIPTLLLFRQERLQLEKLQTHSTTQNKPLAEIYGAEHLLRFFVRMPRQLSGVVVQSDALDSIFEALNQLIDFLETYHSDYFDLGEYVSHEEAMSYMDMPPPPPTTRMPIGRSSSSGSKPKTSSPRKKSSVNNDEETNNSLVPSKKGRAAGKRTVTETELEGVMTDVSTPKRKAGRQPKRKLDEVTEASAEVAVAAAEEIEEAKEGLTEVPAKKRMTRIPNKLND